MLPAPHSLFCFALCHEEEGRVCWCICKVDPPPRKNKVLGLCITHRHKNTEQNFRQLWKKAINCIRQLGRLLLQHKAQGRRHEKQSDVLLHSRRLQLSTHRQCKACSAIVCVCIRRGMGVLQMHGVWGRELVPSLFALPKGYFAHCCLAFATSPHPCASPLSAFQGEFILSLAHCGEWRDWLARGWPGVSWLTVPGQPCWS